MRTESLEIVLGEVGIGAGVTEGRGHPVVVLGDFEHHGRVVAQGGT
ncbi:MAG: hypothetical protein M3163_07175 [Actinomycetota bacterium]|nr:hypothetical protein [Actinomycetota bacterium]